MCSIVYEPSKYRKWPKVGHVFTLKQRLQVVETCMNISTTVEAENTKSGVFMSFSTFKKKPCCPVIESRTHS